jgi:hypothetical protein
MALLALAPAALSSQHNSARPELSDREWNRLRKRAHTPEDFRRLSQWCTAKSAVYLEKRKSFEAELGQYNSEITHSEARYPRRDQTLKLLIQHSGQLSCHWLNLASLYASKSLR